MKELKVRITLQEELLGSQPANHEIHEEFIASKAPNAPSREEEVAAIGVEEAVEKAMTIFHRDKEGRPCLMDYQIRGFFKSAAGATNNMTDSKLKKLSAHKKKVDLYVFTFGADGSRFIPLNMPEGTKMGTCQRPLRAQTAQGERISLANSETVPAGTTMDVIIQTLDDSLMQYVRAWLDYGKYNGLGQWRNSGKGRFTWEEVADQEEEVEEQAEE